MTKKEYLDKAAESFDAYVSQTRETPELATYILAGNEAKRYPVQCSTFGEVEADKTSGILCQLMDHYDFILPRASIFDKFKSFF